MGPLHLLGQWRGRGGAHRPRRTWFLLRTLRLAGLCCAERGERGCWRPRDGAAVGMGVLWLGDTGASAQLP